MRYCRLKTILLFCTILFAPKRGAIGIAKFGNFNASYQAYKIVYPKLRYKTIGDGDGDYFYKVMDKNFCITTTIYVVCRNVYLAQNSNSVVYKSGYLFFLTVYLTFLIFYGYFTLKVNKK